MDLTKDEIVKMARECNLMAGLIPVQSQLERFATLCRAPLVAEVERLEQWHAEMADNRNAIASERDALKAELARVRGSAIPVVEQLVEALKDAQRAFSPAIHVGVSSAIAAGQTFIKESGK